MTNQAKGILTACLERMLTWTVRQTSRLQASCQLTRLRRRMLAKPPRTDGVEHVLHYNVRINDGPNFYTLYKDIFQSRVYHFESQRPDPVILDCGSNIGMSILYFKHLYPRAGIIGFEPDPAIFPYLEENMSCNRLSDVKTVQAAVAGRAGTLAFYSDGKYGSCLAEHLPADAPASSTRHEVPCVRLREYLTGPVDFLKMNIEGAEYEALADAADRLRQVREMVVEYHHLPGLPRTLHAILALLHEQGFEYLINDFDPETNGGVRPPFRLAPDSRYFLLIYARRLDQ